MESLSRPFHSRKLSNATTFSNKNPYDTVFSGHRRNVAGPPLVDVQDYREIFSISQTSSIPVLDLSSLIEQPDISRFNFRESNPDYSKIFGGFRDEDVAVSYDKLFGLDKARAPLSRTPISQDSDDLSDQSQDVLKQFSMSYNKISQKSKDGLDGANHVTQLPAVTGFTCFIDEAVMEGKKQSSSLVSEDTKSRRFDMGFKLHPSNVVNGKKDPKRSMNSEAFKTDFDEELDVNSAAFALRKAIENAQESIRIAKESVGRKNSLRGFSNKKFKKSLKLEGEEQKCRDEDEDEDSSRIFQGVGRNLKHGEKLFVAKKFLDEIHEKISESTKISKFGDDSVVYNANASQVTSETESRFVGSGDKDESATLCSEEIESETSKIHVSDAFQTDNTFVDENESRILENHSVIEEQEVESRDSYNEASLSDADELVEELSNLNVSKKGEEFDQSDNQNRLNETPEDVLEHEDSERLEEVEEAFESVKSGETFDDFCESDANDSAQTCENKLEESEVNLQDDCETKQEDLDQSSDLEFDLKSLDDDSITKETDDNNVGTRQDFDDVAKVSDEGEVKSEENNEKPEITNEVKDSQETECGNTEDETEEPGPSKVPGKERFKRINEEAVTKERERERNRIAVERAIREARERAFAEARERAERERAAVEKATKEVRQRMMAEAHEKVTKASVTNKPSDKTSVQSKLRAERAAVERATSEARQRALEKAISQKTVFDLNRSESALRTKAKLEKQNRIMERAAKALAEKEKRDRLAQKEQAERQRLAENLDADIKRWANGKEGNLRALLSTLQYILGPESGWQPVSLTEIISSSAVKKAYRKATLCVHPDKLQQRGATVQHKYICEKVFDLLKAAWNRFNSEER